jgi:hypothetical protein
MTPTFAPTLDDVLATCSPLARRMFTAQAHLAMVLGYDVSGPYYATEQRREIAQAIAELQAAQAELDPPAGTD